MDTVKNSCFPFQQLYYVFRIVETPGFMIENRELSQILQFICYLPLFSPHWKMEFFINESEVWVSQVFIYSISPIASHLGQAHIDC